MSELRALLVTPLSGSARALRPRRSGGSSPHVRLRHADLPSTWRGTSGSTFTTLTRTPPPQCAADWPHSLIWSSVRTEAAPRCSRSRRPRSLGLGTTAVLNTRPFPVVLAFDAGLVWTSSETGVHLLPGHPRGGPQRRPEGDSAGPNHACQNGFSPPIPRKRRLAEDAARFHIRAPYHRFPGA